MSLHARLRAALARPDPGPHRDEAHILPAESFADAAVLIAITDRAEPSAILTRRCDWLRRHAGQVAFPGGRIDPDDFDAVEAALREAEEEIALPRGAVAVAGVTAPYHAGSGFRITPVIGVIAPDLPLAPDPQEVADIFEVPLAFLLDPANAVERRATINGRERDFLDIAWQDQRIWGVTAGIIANVARRLEGL